MRLLMIFTGLALLLAACAPALAPQIERANGDVLITLTANQPVYSVSVTILDAVTADDRCTSVDSDSWCLVGDLERGQTITIAATGEFGVACTAAGYLDENRSLGSYRPFACRVTQPNQ